MAEQVYRAARVVGGAEQVCRAIQGWWVGLKIQSYKGGGWAEK